MNGRVDLNRREFVRIAAAGAVTALGATHAAFAATISPKAQPDHPAPPHGLIDTNVTLERWPFRRLPLDEAKLLVNKLRRTGVTQAWTGSFDGVFHKDLAKANAHLAEQCREHGRGLLLPFGTINPALPRWEEDVQRCAESHQMQGIRLFPSYHGYRFDNPIFAKLLELAAGHNLIVQIVADLEDERSQSPLARAPHADFAPLPAALDKAPAPVVLLNWFRSVTGPMVKTLADAGVLFDIATVEGVGGVARLITEVTTAQIVFGSNAPLYYFASAQMKLIESALATDQLQAIGFANAHRLLQWQSPR